MTANSADDEVSKRVDKGIGSGQNSRLFEFPFGRATAEEETQKLITANRASPSNIK